jgi:geranylgeranyl diphosphate synthase type II
MAPLLATTTNFDLNTYLDTKKKIVDVALDKSLQATDKNVERIVESMKYSLLAGGKRVRPILVLVS